MSGGATTFSYKRLRLFVRGEMRYDVASEEGTN